MLSNSFHFLQVDAMCCVGGLLGWVFRLSVGGEGERWDRINVWKKLRYLHVPPPSFIRLLTFVGKLFCRAYKGSGLVFLSGAITVVSVVPN